MREDLEKRLQNDFTFMKPSSNPYGQYACEVLDGWFDLLYNMCKEIKATDSDIEIRQIKQKYGRLRVCYRTSDPKVDEIVDKYETLSETTCEECGEHGTYRKEHMIVLCDKCFHTAKGDSYDDR